LKPNRRRSSLLSLSALAVMAALLLPLPGAAQRQEATPRQSRADRARHVSAQVQAFYDQTQSLETRFYQTFYHRAYGRYMRSRGTLRIDKPGRMRFDYDRPNGKIVVSDGARILAYEPGDDSGEPGQYFENTLAADPLSALSFLTGDARLEQTYRTRLLDARRYHFAGHVLELRPRRADPRVRRILLFVDAHPERAGVIHRLRIDDHDGNRNKIELRRTRFNRELSDALFSWRPPAGARRVGG